MYRIYDKVNKEYLDNKIYVVNQDNVIIRILNKKAGKYPDYYRFKKQSNYIIEQYTGIKDVNGKEIYVGDRVETQTIHRNIGVTYFENGMFRVDFEDCVINLNNHRWEIIGNIHDV